MASIYSLNWPDSRWIHFTISTFAKCELKSTISLSAFFSPSPNLSTIAFSLTPSFSRNAFASLKFVSMLHRSHKCAWKSTYAEQRAIAACVHFFLLLLFLLHAAKTKREEVVVVVVGIHLIHPNQLGIFFYNSDWVCKWIEERAYKRKRSECYYRRNKVVRQIETTLTFDWQMDYYRFEWESECEFCEQWICSCVLLFWMYNGNSIHITSLCARK